MHQQFIQISNLTADQFGDLVEARSYQGTLKALNDHQSDKQKELPNLLTRRQTAEELQVSLTTLHEWGKDTVDRPAILIPLKINGRVRYRREDVLAALKETRRFKLAAKNV